MKKSIKKKEPGKQKTGDFFKPRKYTRKEVAGFLLNDAMNEDGYRRIRKQVESMGLDPESIPHDLPSELAEKLRKRGLAKSYRESLLKDLADQAEAVAFLNAILEDAAREKDGRLLALALQDVIEAQGGKPQEPRMLCRGASGLVSIAKILESLGFRLSVVTEEKPKKP